MATPILFVQGAGEGAHDQWDDKLVADLERRVGAGYDIQFPRMPNEGEPRYGDWKAALLKQFDALADGAILVGHSVGGTILLHALADVRPKLSPRAVMLIAAPFIGEGGWPSDEIEADRDLAARLPTGAAIFLYHGTKDPIVPFRHVELYQKAIPQAVVRALTDRDHQLDNDLSEIADDIGSLRR